MRTRKRVKYLSISEFAKVMLIGRTTAWRWVRDGKIPVTNFKGHRLINPNLVPVLLRQQLPASVLPVPVEPVPGSLSEQQ